MARDFSDIRPRRVVLEADVDAAPAERIADLAYQERDPKLLLDVYRPGGAQGAFPGVMFVHGDSWRDPDALRDMKDWGQYVSWGELTAASGLAAVTFTHRSSHGGRRIADVRDDVDAALRFVHANRERLGIDDSRLALVGISMGVPYAVSRVLERPGGFRCAVALYGPMDLRGAPLADADGEALEAISPLHHLQAGRDAPPLLIAKAGRDDPGLNDTIDAFVAEALARNLDIDLLTHADGPHAFDVMHDSERSRHIVRAALAFLTHQLA